ncbi:MAG: hypothetical protein IPN19_01975 [Elusimicrobia bacterium]|nr:hypothetical protein [Elusimicrobiota bacterium]
MTIDGEALLPRPGQPNFVADEKLLTKWDPVYKKEAIDEAMHKKSLTWLVKNWRNGR